MSTNFKIDDVTRGVDSTDLDDRYVTESWLIDRFTQGTLFAWGSNNNGKLGLGDTLVRSVPTQVGIRRGYDTTTQNGQLTYEWYNHTATVHPTTTSELDAFFTTATAGVTLGGSGVYSSIINWGDSGQTSILGTVGTKPAYLPAESYSWRAFGFILAPETGTYTFSVDGDDACDIRVNGQIVAFWYDGHGFSSQTTRPASAVGTIALQAGKIYPIEIRFEEIAVGDGIAAAWQLPSGGGIVAIPPSVFVRGNFFEWRYVSSSATTSPTDDSQTLMIRQDNSMYACGFNGSGQLGLGDTTNRSTPVQIGAQTNWKTASAGSLHSIALTNSGTAYVWGNNTIGQLGLGDIIHRSSPVQLGSVDSWKFVHASYIRDITYAIKTDGSLWSWGSNTNGLLGLGASVHRSSPSQVGSRTDWKQLSSSSAVTSAITNSGSLFIWGINTNGALGLGFDTVTIISTPVQIGSDTDWQSIHTYDESCISVKTNGTLWTWGSNTFGVLGLGDTIHRSSPVQIGSLHSWKTAIVGRAVQKDGTLWVWGVNTSNALGLGDTTTRSSPTQVGIQTNWKSAIRNFALTYKE